MVLKCIALCAHGVARLQGIETARVTTSLLETPPGCSLHEQSTALATL